MSKNLINITNITKSIFQKIILIGISLIFVINKLIIVLNDFHQGGITYMPSRFERISLLISNFEFFGIAIVIVSCLYLNIRYYKSKLVYLLTFLILFKDLFFTNISLLFPSFFIYFSNPSNYKFYLLVSVIFSNLFFALLLGIYQIWLINIFKKPVELEKYKAFNNKLFTPWNKLNQTNSMKVLYYILMVVITLLAGASIYLTIKGLLFGNITGELGGARNGLEAFSVLLFGLPIYITFNLCHITFINANKQIYKNLNIYKKRMIAWFVIIGIVIISTIALLYFYQNYYDNNLAVTILTSYFGIFIILPTIYDLFLTRIQINKKNLLFVFIFLTTIIIAGLIGGYLYNDYTHKLRDIETVELNCKQGKLTKYTSFDFNINRKRSVFQTKDSTIDNYLKTITKNDDNLNLVFSLPSLSDGLYVKTLTGGYSESMVQDWIKAENERRSVTMSKYGNLIESCYESNNLNYLFQELKTIDKSDSKVSKSYSPRTGDELHQYEDVIIPESTCYLKKVTINANDYPDCSSEIKAKFGL